MLHRVAPSGARTRKRIAERPDLARAASNGGGSLARLFPARRTAHRETLRRTKKPCARPAGCAEGRDTRVACRALVWERKARCQAIAASRHHPGAANRAGEPLRGRRATPAREASRRRAYPPPSAEAAGSTEAPEDLPTSPSRAASRRSPCPTRKGGGASAAYTQSTIRPALPPPLPFASTVSSTTFSTCFFSYTVSRIGPRVLCSTSQLWLYSKPFGFTAWLLEK